VTGDAPATAAIVAKAVGLDGAICPPGPIPDAVHPEQFAVFAGVLPEDKYKLVKAFQKGGHTVGMCGDGANDAPALRQAQMGIAVSTATDVAKSAAGMVLTEPGLAGIVAAVKEGRITFQRILSYTLNSITKKTVQVLFLAIGLLISRCQRLPPHSPIDQCSVYCCFRASEKADRGGAEDRTHLVVWSLTKLVLE
jgi:H+-transporting ATPase